ncbi:TetR/AcrR family transcriptional regulator [Streptomyces griseoviridis]|uniref:TetR family transcriptional regulator n=2 Tax=Streptomyces TaxID=1883 RepID=A0A3Q9KQ71_STRGD|nr:MULTISPECIES: TetR/AcrR family transcriptional regulator [Streptomyces]AZS84617.1 TetR/AcrR family transcriptional regulator [Streptomyces griseoviridis]MDH6701287.1 AcrR family transcriptional regulator [Streptomyces sp. MAA16]MDT0476246.1 TetR/AcrR family transcriptional regulator [Streptomyces sp. DSM 41014]QCN88527.1 TetR family transcriptional regulator [Streptomyces griseoviridis]
MPSADRRLQPRRTPRQVRAELTRERVLTAAAHVFAEYGYAAGTTNRIAERARVSIGSLYQYFPNKDAILAELLVRHIDRGTWTRTDRLDLSPGSLEAAVRILVRDAIDNHRDDPQLLRIMIEQAPVSRELLDTMDRHSRIRGGEVRDFLARHPDVRVRDLDTAAELILFTVETNTHKLMADPRGVPVETFESELVDMVTRYLSGSP